MASAYQKNQNQQRGRPWSTGLFDCHEDQTDAVMTAFCPCATFGQIAEVLDNGEMRTKLRTKYGLVEAPYTDAISHVFCPCCSLCQEFRELKSQGLDPTLGWNGILAQQQGNQCQGETPDVPPPAQAMSK